LVAENQVFKPDIAPRSKKGKKTVIEERKHLAG
jgi:hypothetical protein